METKAENQTRKSLQRSFLVTAVKFVLAATVIYFAGRQLVINWTWEGSLKVHLREDES